VPQGPCFERRAIHASIYADRVLVGSPELPVFSWRFGTDHDIVELMAHSTEFLAGPEPAPRPTPDPDTRDTMDRYLDEDYERDRVDWPNKVNAIDAFKGEAVSLIPTVAADWLAFAWTVRQPTAEGWLEIVHPGMLMTDNIKTLRRDNEFWDALAGWNTRLNWTQQEPAFRQLLTAAGLTRELDVQQVLTLPASSDAVQLFETVARYFRLEDVPYGGVLIDDLLPPPRAATLSSNAELLRGSWFDQLLVGLGPITLHLDGTTACAVRSSAAAAALTEFLTSELNRLAFADAGIDRARLLAENQSRLQKIAEATVAAATAADSATLRNRLSQGGIWGTSGLAVGFIGTLLTGGALAVAAAAAGVGFMLTAAAGAGAASAIEPVVPFPFLIDILKASAADR
jgi:hypothetical protein